VSALLLSLHLDTFWIHADAGTVWPKPTSCCLWRSDVCQHLGNRM